MIIEIKDLPSDRKVKHITFDITFEDDGTPIIKSTPVVPQTIVQPHVNPTSNLNFPSTPEGPNPRAIVERPHRDIPPEMTNAEF